MRCVLLICILAAVLYSGNAQNAINVRPTTQATCNFAGVTWSSLAPMYLSTSSVPTATCYFTAYEVPCPTLRGVIPCDTTVSQCVSWTGSASYRNADTAGAWNKGSGSVAPSECLRYGTWKLFPDVSVIVVVQPLVSGLVFIGLGIATGIIFHKKVNWFSITIVIFMCIVGIMQTVSYYYLNAYIIIASGLTALAAYSRRTPLSIGFGMFVLLGAFFWVTFSSGLGYIQHHSRLTAGDAVTDAYESICNSYYSGYFTFPRVLMSDTQNVQTQFRGYCGRRFIAGQLFLMIIQEYFLILLVMAGVFAIPRSQPSKAENPLRQELTESF